MGIATNVKGHGGQRMNDDNRRALGGLNDGWRYWGDRVHRTGMASRSGRGTGTGQLVVVEDGGGGNGTEDH